MRVRKVILACVMLLIVAVHTSTIGWAAVTDSSAHLVAAGCLLTAFALYVLVLASLSIRESNIDEHWATTIHLSSLTTTAVSLLAVAAALPSVAVEDGVLRALNYVSLTLWAVAWFIAVRTKRGPKLHYPSDLVYSEKTLSGTTTRVEDNVCGITGTHFLSA